MIRRILFIAIMLFAFGGFAKAQDTCPSTAVAFGITGVHCFFASQSGADTNAGTKAAPWKHLRGMVGCASNCLAHTPTHGEGFILKGGDVWDKTNLPWQWTWAGTATTSTDGCTGANCIYLGYDPTWNDGIVNAVIVNKDYGGCPSSTTVALSGGGGASAAATAHMIGNAVSFGDGGFYIGYYTVTNQGSGYTSNPTATITGAGCRNAVAVADITRPVIDAGGQVWTATLMGTSSAIVYSSNNQSNFTIWDNFEIRNVILDNATASIYSAYQNDNNLNVTATNFYVHNWGLNTRNTGSGDGAEYGIRMFVNNGGTSHMLVDNVRVNNGEQVINCTFVTATQCSAGNATAGQGTFRNSKLSFYPWAVSGSNIIHDNDVWGVAASDNGGHTNIFYEAQGTPPQFYIYNNIYHDNDAGAFSQITQGASTTWWIFNNVCWYCGAGGSFVIDTATTSTGSSTINFANNTLNTRTDSAYNNGNGASNITGLHVNLYNMDAITDQTTNLWWFSTGGQFPNTINGISSPNNTTPNPFNYVPTQATALATNYTTSNAYQPTSGSSPTVTFSGTNLTSSCTGLVVPLCSDINGVARPAVGAWQAGAYFFGGGSPTAGTPTCSPAGGTFSVTQNPTCSVAGGAPVICYTTNGTMPATNGTNGCTTGTLYTGAISISSSTNINLIAGGTSFTDGLVQSYTYIINPVTTAPAAATFAMGISQKKGIVIAQ